jgi:small-conductance mechanosensitive channel
MACLLLTFVALFSLPGYAATPEPPPDIDKVLDTARAQIDSVQKKLATLADTPLNDDQLTELRAQALEAQRAGEAVAATLEPQLVSVRARLAELGAPVEGTLEGPDVALQRKQLGKDSATLDAQLKLSRLITVEADQAAERILKQRRVQFQAQLGARTITVLAPGFWHELRDEFPGDLERLEPIKEDLVKAGSDAGGAVWGGVLAAIVAALGLRLLAGRLLMRLSTTRVAPGRLRRSLYAVMQVILTLIAPTLIAGALVLAIAWNREFSGPLTILLNQFIGTVAFGAFIAGLGHAMLTPHRPTWRLAPINDRLALSVRWFPLVIAVIVPLSWLAQRTASLVNASLAATVALDCITALAIALVIGGALRHIRSAGRQTSDDATTPAAPVPFWLTMLLGLIRLTVIVSLACLLVGYVALGSFIIKQLVWIALVVAATYLITGLLSDLGDSLLAKSRRHAEQAPAASPFAGARGQAIVLLSGAARVLVVFFAVILLLSRFGGGPTEWLHQLDYLQTGIAIGEIRILPASVITAILVLTLGLGAVRLLQGWLAKQYLPTTSLDPGMQLSAATLFGYAGYVFAVAMSLSAVGIGLERVAWIASALSVGIGFGLQAVVQNFVSGLILLAERPVKVGDWVSLGGVEGDIRRINVRATEIQMGDRSTVIVPNSEFITKVVRNVTMANPLGRVQIKLALPVNTDAAQAHDLILAAFVENPDMLAEPAAEVMLDGIDATSLVFNATGYVGSPRMAYRVRSDLLFDVLRRLRAANLPLATPPTMAILPAPSGDEANTGKQSPDNPLPGKG